MIEKDGYLQDLLNYWPLVVAGIAGIFGYAEVKMQGKSNARDIKSLAEDIEKRRVEDNKRQDDMLAEIRADIKLLLQRRD